MPHRVRTRVNRLRGLCGTGARVDTHFAEVVSKSRLEECACSQIKRLARGSQYVMHDRRYFSDVVWIGCIVLQSHFFSLAVVTLVSRRLRTFASTLTLQDSSPG